MSPEEKKLPTRKLFAGAIVAPMMAVLMSSNGVNICTAICVVMTLICWFLLYLRVSANIRNINWGTRRSVTPIDRYAAPPPSIPHDDSRSLFL